MGAYEQESGPVNQRLEKTYVDPGTKSTHPADHVCLFTSVLGLSLGFLTWEGDAFSMKLLFFTLHGVESSRLLLRSSDHIYMKTGERVLLPLPSSLQRPWTCCLDGSASRVDTTELASRWGCSCPVFPVT